MKRIVTTLAFAAIMLGIAMPSYSQLPSAQLKDLKGNIVETSSLGNDGKPYIIDFWATWCKPCLRELKAIHDLYPDWQDETGVKIYAISVDDAQNALRVKPFVERQGWTYDILLDPNKDFAQAMGASNVPHTIIVDGSGKIVWSHSGYTDGSEEELIEKVRELIAK